VQDDVDLVHFPNIVSIFYSAKLFELKLLIGLHLVVSPRMCVTLKADSRFDIRKHLYLHYNGAVVNWLACRLLDLWVACSNPDGDTFSTRKNLE